MDNLIERMNTDAMLRLHGAYYSTQISIVSDDEINCFDISQGEVSRLDSKVPAGGFSLVASPDVWSRYCMDIPPPEYHELGAMLSMGHLKIEGDMKVMQSNMMYVRCFLELWREDQLDTNQ